jgi:hypothetical protein
MAKEMVADAVTRAQIASARARGESEQGSKARNASYDAEAGRLVVELTNGCVFGFPPDLAQGLRGASPADLGEVEVVMDGDALHWGRLDADLLVSELVRGVFGSRPWMREIARELGSRGGRARTVAKAAAARRNGRKGGRPRK